MYGRTDIWDPLILLGPLGGVDLKIPVKYAIQNPDK